MTEEQCQQVYDALAEMLRREGLSWAVAQVENEIRLGNIIDKPIKETTGRRYSEKAFEVLESSDQRLPAKTAYVQQRVEYTNKECLSMLIRAVEHAVLHIGDMEDHTLSLLAKTGNAATLAFEPDATDERSFTIRPADVDSRKQACAELKVWLDQLKQEADAD